MEYPKKYTPEGSSLEIIRGDLVWWNEGTMTGYVHQIIEGGHDLIDCEVFDEPHLSFNSLHPYNPDADWNNGIFYPHSVLEDEGVGVLSSHEQAELHWAVKRAHELTSNEYRDWSYQVSVIKDLDRGEEDWVIEFIRLEDVRSDMIKVPLRPNTRTIIG